MSKFLVETSARHVHVSQEHLEILFGEGAKLTPVKDLSQPGQYACQERVTIVGTKNQISNVVILGPTRNSTQVELSATDARSIGIPAPIRESGDTKGSASCKVVGPAGEVELTEGVIVAKRHIHLTPEDAKELEVSDREVVWVKIESADRTTILGDVVCRVNPTFARAMHIDTDESNAVSASREQYGEIIRI